jgi:predicted Zn-dependent protease
MVARIVSPHPPRWRLAALCFFTTVAVLVGLGCGGAEPPGQGEGPGHRQQTLALSPQQELELGRRSFREVLADPGKYGRRLPEDNPAARRIRDVTGRLIKAYEIKPLRHEINLREGYHFEWEVAVLERNEANAFCLPGGKIAVFTGILQVAEDDAQLATVLSHEMSHALAHHTAERLARRGADQGVFSALRSKAFDREQEAEADHIGLFLMTFAGYDPNEALRFWERMQRASRGRQPPEILSDHPSDEHRIQNIQKWLPDVLDAKKAYDEGKIAQDAR